MRLGGILHLGKDGDHLAVSLPGSLELRDDLLRLGELGLELLHPLLEGLALARVHVHVNLGRRRLLLSRLRALLSRRLNLQRHGELLLERLDHHLVRLVRREDLASLTGDLLLGRELLGGGGELLLEALALLVANLQRPDELAELGPQLLLRGGGRAVGLDGEFSLEQLLLVLLLDRLELRGVESLDLREALVHGGAGDKLGLEVLDVRNLPRDFVDELWDVALDGRGGGAAWDGGSGRGGSHGDGLRGLG